MYSNSFLFPFLPVFVSFIADSYYVHVCLLFTRYSWPPFWKHPAWIPLILAYLTNMSRSRFEVFTAVTVKNAIFWYVTPCGSYKNPCSSEMSVLIRATWCSIAEYGFLHKWKCFHLIHLAVSTTEHIYIVNPVSYLINVPPFVHMNIFCLM
jgi:hypothetical protein